MLGVWLRLLRRRGWPSLGAGVVHRVCTEPDLVLVAVPAPAVEGMVRGLDGKTLADLAQGKDEALMLAVLDVGFEVLDVVGREQIPAVGRLDDPRRGVGRVCGRTACRDEFLGIDFFG
jgi:hypothetical protein